MQKPYSGICYDFEMFLGWQTLFSAEKNLIVLNSLE